MTVSATPTTDRRVAPRHRPAYRTVCHLVRDEPHDGLVLNISRTGVSMFLGSPPAVGANLPAMLSPEGEMDGLPVTLRVVHVKKSATGDYLIGARFDRTLGEDEIQPFLAAPGRPPRKG